MAKDEKEEKKAGAPPDDPDKDFWEAEGVTDDEEKEAIKSRARVIAYAEHRKKRAEEAEKNKGKPKKGGKWFKED